jgi:hypothetical protein
MQMNVLFAAGLFENPWVIAVILIAGALANWLSKRRQENQAEQQAQGDQPPQEPAKTQAEFNLEETLRRLMGEPPSPAPPPIRRATRGELPPVADWQEEEPYPGSRPIVAPPPIAPQATIALDAAREQQVAAARRFEQLQDLGHRPATAVHRHGRRASTGRSVTLWRDPRTARHAFVASTVFAPPKSLES